MRYARIALGIIFWLGITLLFLDFTGTAAVWLGWMARLQLLPAVLAGNFVIVALLVVLTLIFGRLYCSVICPLGVMQDGFAALGRRGRRNRYSYSPAKSLLRYVMLVVMLVAVVLGVGSVFAIIAPYSAYGRIVTNLLQPVWITANNFLVRWAAAHDSYAFYEVDVWIKSVLSLAVAVVTLIVLAVLAWRNGRTYCNTICPVGTVLGFISRFSLLKPVIDTSKCINCGKCARNCKAACIDAKNHAIDYSRCVTCFDCIGNCSTGAISYRRPHKDKGTPKMACERRSTDRDLDSVAPEDSGRRSFLSVSATIAAAAVADAQIKLDGGLAVIEDKKIPERNTPVTPPGSLSYTHLLYHCTGCQLCVAACPNGVIRPSTDPSHFLMPVVSYERGYCRPECTRCSELCPAGAIQPITREEKSSISIGHAVFIPDNCITVTDGHECGNCFRHCPTGAITMVPSDASDPKSRKMPRVDIEKCIGCGACENLCPARPLSAIYVEGNHRHRQV
ncbi:MAG: 4Fe-4S dicluster domain-containing protein [Clostridiales bacterium]|nr:4Fe-4S dicluster domain-containing protein [Clostridiales bacterium]